MSLRLLRSCLCLVMLGCATTPTVTERAPAGSEVPSCTPGELLFALSYRPLDLVPIPDGRSLLVVDRGFLALRDVSTLKIQRYLLPQVDGWGSATLSPDGRTLTAQTVDGQRYAFDTTTWKAERLVDARVTEYERERAELEFIIGSPAGTEFFKQGEVDSQLEEALREPALIQELTKHPLFPFVSALDAARQQLLIGETKGSLTLLDLAGQRILKRVPCEECSPYVLLSADVEGFLGVTAAGRLHVLDRELKVVREVAFLLPGRTREDEPLPRFVLRVVRAGGGSRVAWLTRDHELGLFDLETGTHVVRLPGQRRGGASMAALLDARRLAVLTEGTLRVWDMPEQRVLVEKRGPYASAVRLDADRLLATRGNGIAELVSSHSGEVLGSFCATRHPCVRDPKTLERLEERVRRAAVKEAGPQLAELAALRASRHVELLVSPDQRTLVSVTYPEDTRAGGPAIPGFIGTWRLPGLEPLGMRPFTQDDGMGEVRFGAGGMLYIESQPLSAEGLPTRSAGSEPDGAWVEPDKRDVRVYAGGGLSVWVDPSLYENEYDEARLLGPGERPLGVISTSSMRARSWPLRRETFADVLPSGERFLIASKAPEPLSKYGSAREPSGATLVWCSSRETPPPPFPEAPPLPAVMELDGPAEERAPGQYAE